MCFAQSICQICAKKHKTNEHNCNICNIKGQECPHSALKCSNCGESLDSCQCNPCDNCGEYPNDCECNSEQAEAHYMRRWEESMEEYNEDQIPNES